MNIGLKKSFHPLLPGCDTVVLTSAVADAPVNDLDHDTNTYFNLVNDLDTLTLRLELPVIVCI